MRAKGGKVSLQLWGDIIILEHLHRKRLGFDPRQWVCDNAVDASSHHPYCPDDTADLSGT